MVKITYQYKGTKAIPTKWFNGNVIENHYEPCWYDGSEEVKKSEAKARLKELAEIVGDDGEKKYRNIQLNMG